MITQLPEAAQHYVDVVKTANDNRNRLRFEIIELERQLSESRFHLVSTAALDAVMANVEAECIGSISLSDLLAIREETLRQIGMNFLS